MRREIYFNLLTTILTIFIFCSVAFPDSTLYSADFSSDPGWTTDQSGNFYWYSRVQAYHAKTENQYPGYSPSRYAYVQFPQFSGSFNLQWDIDITKCDTSASIGFGLYDSHLSSIYSSGYPSIQMNFTVEDWTKYGAGIGRGNGIAINELNHGYASYEVYFYNMKWNFNSWYTCNINFNDITNIAEFKFSPKGSSTVLWSKSYELDGFPADFTPNLRYLGISASGIGDSGNYGDLIPTASAEGYIDNVILTVPEPSTVLFIILGSIIARKCI